MEHQCSNHEEISSRQHEMSADIKIIREDVKQLLDFRGKVLGAISILSVVITLLVNVGIKKLLN